jgi:hypothetical protein
MACELGLTRVAPQRGPESDWLVGAEAPPAPSCLGHAGRQGRI